MMTKILIGLGVVVVLGGGAYYYYTQSSLQNSEQEEGMEEAMEEGNMMEEGPGIMEEAHVVMYTDSGYSPNSLTIQKGETVTFKNESSRDMWPATAIHPSHTVYPGSSIGKCDTAEEESIFDACRGIGSDREYSFVFNEVGQWNYHDHLRTTNWGTITVEE